MANDSTAVWYDDQHLSGHVQATKIKTRDNVTHWDESVRIDTLRMGGNSQFRGQVTGQALNAISGTQEIVNGTQHLAPYFLYQGLTNPNNFSQNDSLIILPQVDGQVRSVGGCAVVIQYLSGGPNQLGIQIDSFGVANYPDPNGVVLDLGEIVFCIWVGDKWRLIQTNGTVE